MTTLSSQKSPYAFKLDQRATSLVKISEPYGNTSHIQPTNLSQKSFVSFQSSFRMNSSLPHSSKKFRGTSSHRPGEFLQEITNSLPKISSGGVTNNQLSSQLAAVISKKTQINTKYTDYDFEPSHTNKKPLQSVLSQSQRSILTHPNKSVPDIQDVKLGFDASPNNHHMTNRSPVQSIMSVSSPKKTIIIEEKLPLKRRALNSDIKEAYRAVINSKEHGAFHDLPQKSFDRDPTGSPPPRNKNKKISYIDHAKELEKKEREKEEERLADEIKTKGVGDFHRKIALYNFIRGNYLVDPDNEIDFKPSAASNRKIVVPVKVQKEPKKDFLASFGQNLSNQFMNSRAHSRDSFEKSEMLYSRRIEDRDSRRVGEDNDGGSSKRAEAKEDTVKMKGSTMEQDLKKMQELGSFLSSKKPLSENEHLIFKLVKDGNEQDLGYLLAKNPELVKAEDNTKQTPLHWAIKRGYYGIVVCLCKSGADIHAADMTDRKPIEMAERLKQTEILDYLKVVNKKRELENRF